MIQMVELFPNKHEALNSIYNKMTQFLRIISLRIIQSFTYFFLYKLIWGSYELITVQRAVKTLI
jgi:TRAP-type C4-dicarboxylate transport system permease small subunit